MTAENSHAAAPTDSASNNKQNFFPVTPLFESIDDADRALLIALTVLSAVSEALLTNREFEKTVYEFEGPASGDVINDARTSCLATIRHLRSVSSIRSALTKALAVSPTPLESLSPSQQPAPLGSERLGSSHSVSDPQNLQLAGPASPPPGEPPQLTPPPESQSLPSQPSFFESPPALTTNQDAGGSFLSGTDAESEGVR